MEIISSKPVKAGERHDCHIPHSHPMRGKPGPQGEAATIEIVDVVTVEPTDPARVENLGDASNAKIVMYIPKGDQGNAGQDGAPGEPGDDYVLTEEDKKEIAEMIEIPEGEGVAGGYYTPNVSQADADTMTVSFTASGDKMPPVPSASITLPAGRQGEQGPQGEKGDTGATGAQGIQGEKGEKGDTGDKGDPGSDYVLTEADKQEIADMAIIVSTEQPTETGVFWYDPDDEESEDGGTTELQPLTFTGAVEATYDGSEAVSVEIPSGGGSEKEWKTLLNLTTEEEVSKITIDTDVDGQPFDVKELIFVGRIFANESATAGPFCRFHVYDADGNDGIKVQTQQGFVPASGTIDYRVRLEYIESAQEWYREPMFRSVTKNIYGSEYSYYTGLNGDNIPAGYGTCTKIIFDARANMGVGSIIRIFGR